MKIVQVQTQAEAAGAQRVSDMLGAGLRADGHDVRTVFMYRKTDAYDADEFADIVLPHRPKGALDQLRAIAGLIGYMRRERPDAVIAFQHYGNIFGVLAARLAGVKRIIANQSGAPGTSGALGLTAKVDKLMGRLGAYQHSVVNSSWTEAQFADYPQSYRHRLARIDHGVLLSMTTLNRAEARTKFGLPDNAFLVVSTGRFTKDKNQRALIEALAKLPDVHLALAGIGPEQAVLESLAAERQVTDRLHFVGEVQPCSIFDFLAAGDMFAFASRNETFGLSVAEAALFGLPVVSSGLPVLREVLGDAAIYADAEQPDEMAAAIGRVMREPGLAQRLSTAGRALAERYSPAVMCRGYEALLLA